MAENGCGLRLLHITHGRLVSVCETALCLHPGQLPGRHNHPMLRNFSGVSSMRWNCDMAQAMALRILLVQFHQHAGHFFSVLQSGSSVRYLTCRRW